ncbi:hypothetical protein E4K72_18130 [Oxalobacteraceae bacterium OM1]|nr:hypothetical protein E4K72_18130 [Oxalobacteraceae bacterium OM1]
MMQTASTFTPSAGFGVRTQGYAEPRMPVTTRFGELVDVRNRGALRLARLVGIQVPGKEAPAVVRLWSGDTCRELSSGEARALAAQLLDAARHAEKQNLG